MSARSTCLQCGSTKIITAQMQQPTAFCVDHAIHHGVLHIALKASLCERCGYVEFWLPDPHILNPPQEHHDVVLQEEDF